MSFQRFSPETEGTSYGAFRMSFQSLRKSWFLQERVSRQARL
jgi:hypothetical protein